MFLLKQTTHRMIIQHDPEFGHRYVPSISALVPHESCSYYVRTNAAGFRSDVSFVEARSKRPRILFFGDSFTAGDGVENAERFSDRIGVELGAESYNFGLSASGTDQHLLIARRFARRFRPDAIVLSLFVENIERNLSRYRKSRDRASGRVRCVPQPWFDLDDDALVLHGVPVGFERPDISTVDPVEIRDTVPGLRAQQRLDRRTGRIVDPYPDYREPNSLGVRLLRRLVETFCDELGPCPIVLMPIPSPAYHYAVEPSWHQLYASIVENRDHVSYCDITTPIRAMTEAARAVLLFETDIHFTSAGHSFVADQLAECLVEIGAVPRPDIPTRVKKKRTPRTPQGGRYVLGLSAFYHDSAAALIGDGEILAAAHEERFSRIKNDRRFPSNACLYCLEEAGIHYDQLTAVAYYDSWDLTLERVLHGLTLACRQGPEPFVQSLQSWVRYKLQLPRQIRRILRCSAPIYKTRHHRAHAASAFFPSPFERAAVLIVDGVGEWATASWGIAEGSRLELCEELRFPDSLGLLYSAFAQYLGFEVNSGEYKMMGLAPHGDPNLFETIEQNIARLHGDGSLTLELEMFEFLSGTSMVGDAFAAVLGERARERDEPITTHHSNAARSVQAFVEEAILRMSRYIHERTGETKLCLAGGVALNCVANGRLLREGPFDDIWIQPAAGDAGGALGAALDIYYALLGGQRKSTRSSGSQGSSLLGPQFSDDEITAFLRTGPYPAHELDSSTRGQRVAALVAQGKIVGHFDGRAEFGPRALGARSIIADPRRRDTQARLNSRIKYRESFRPFAPAVIEDRIGDYFELDRPSPYMLVVAPVRSELRLPFERVAGEDVIEATRRPRSSIPAVTHIDFSARVQSVGHDGLASYRDVLQAFEEQTGCGVLVNTSFNVRGEPIVNTPADAYRCFMRTEMDAVVIGNWLLLKDEQVPKESVSELGEPGSHESRDLGLETLCAQLMEVYSRTFASLVRDHGKDVFDRTSRRSGWVASEAFEVSQLKVASVFFDAKPDIATLVDALVEDWGDGELSVRLHEVVVALAELSLEHSGDDDGKVSDSLYMMF